MNWTKPQQRAIEARGNGLLVSAAAGSGKTTVMVERILSLALEGVPLDRMLIVTFTRAAAASMREKLSRELERRMQADARNTVLRRQSEALRRADISTYSSFLVNVLRQYYYLLNIPPDFKILDRPELAKMEDEALDEVLEGAGDVPHLEALERLLIKGGKDKSLCDAILLIYGHISIFPYPQKRLEEMLSDYASGGEIWLNALRNGFQEQLICLREDAEELKRLAPYVGGKNNCEQIAQYDMQLIEALIEAESFEDMAALKPAPYMSLRIKDGLSGAFRARHDVIKSALQGIMADAGVEVVCMEVSAHALYLRKLVGVVFEAAAYTNLSQDHLDFFGTMDNYLAAKKLLFSAGMARNAAVNVDEETAKAVCDSLDCPLLTYGISGKADLFARDIEITETGVSFTLNLRNLHAERVHLLLTGMFNVYNALAAAACALILGVELDAIKRGLEAVVSVPGRVEMLPTKTPYRMILDYSHSPDALENILKTVREFCHGRIILVFGCGGDRDKGKRPMMGEIAGRLADYAILTSDNPRFEDPMAILAAIEAGIKPTGAKYEVIENRREAIRQAMEMAVSGDIVVLAGKGHETYQEIRGVKHPFDEKVIVSELLEEIAGENRAE